MYLDSRPIINWFKWLLNTPPFRLSWLPLSSSNPFNVSINKVSTMHDHVSRQILKISGQNWTQPLWPTVVSVIMGKWIITLVSWLTDLVLSTSSHYIQQQQRLGKVHLLPPSSLLPADQLCCISGAQAGARCTGTCRHSRGRKTKSTGGWVVECWSLVYSDECWQKTKTFPYVCVQKLVNR